MNSSAFREVPKPTLELNGLCVLIVEDSWHVGVGLQNLLESWGAEAMGPAASAAEADRVTVERTPDVAIVDINLRRGERSHELIDRLHDQGVQVIVITGYADNSLPPSKAVAILQKPLKEDLLLANLLTAKIKRDRTERKFNKFP
jgi:DNA-binding NtrC family response regulator